MLSARSQTKFGCNSLGVFSKSFEKLTEYNNTFEFSYHIPDAALSWKGEVEGLQRILIVEELSCQMLLHPDMPKVKYLVQTLRQKEDIEFSVTVLPGCLGFLTINFWYRI